MITEYDDELDYIRPKQQRFLIGHLGMYGDVLYALAIARQLKHDYPNCHVTFAVATIFRSVLHGNPYIDEIWEYAIATRADITNMWFDFAELAEELKRHGRYDEIFLSQVFPGNPDRLYDTIRQSIFRAYPNPITVPIQPVIILSQEEVDRVAAFAEKHHLNHMRHVILFESAPGSGQSGVTPEFVKRVSFELSKIQDAVIILSGKDPVDTPVYNIIDGSTLSLREMVALTHYCTFLIGSSSGVTWICQSEQAKPLPTVQLLTDGSIASLINDHTYHNLPTDQIIELVSPSAERVVSCVTACICGNFADAKERYSVSIIPDFAIVRFHARAEKALISGSKMELFTALMILADDYGVSWDLAMATFPLPQRFIHRMMHKGG